MNGDSVPREISPIRSESDRDDDDDGSIFSSSSSSSRSVSSTSSFSSTENSSRSSYQERYGDNINAGGWGSKKRRRSPHRRQRQRRRRSSRRRRSTRSRSSSSNENEPYDRIQTRKDWECGICANINSMQRDECYRCGVLYVHALRYPSDEICAANVPERFQVSALVQVLQRSLEEAQSKNSSVNAVGINLVILDASREDRPLDDHRGRSRRYENQEGQLHSVEICSRVFFKFLNEEAATIALQLCHCRLAVPPEHGDSNTAGTFPLFFSARKSNGSKVAPRRGQKQNENLMPHSTPSLSNGPQNSASPAVTANTVPKELAAEHWVPPTSFTSPEEEKAYLELLSSNWSQLSDEQKHYYDNAVKSAIAKQQEIQAAPVVPAVVAAPRPSVSTTISSLKEQIAARKAALANGSNSATVPATAPASVPASVAVPATAPAAVPLPVSAAPSSLTPVVSSTSVPAATSITATPVARKTTPTSLEEIKAAIAKRKAAKQVTPSVANVTTLPAPPQQAEASVAISATTSSTLDSSGEEKPKAAPTVQLKLCNGFLVPPPKRQKTDSMSCNESSDEIAAEMSGENFWKHDTMQVTFQIARRILNRQLLP